MLRLRISVRLASLPLRFHAALDAARRLGADAVEIDARGEVNPAAVRGTGLRQVRKLLDDHNLSVAAVEFRTRRGYHVADGLDRRVEATRQAMEFAHALGAPIVTNHVGAVPADEAAPEWKLLADVLTDLALYSQRSGTVLCALTGTESGASLGKLLERLPKGLIGVTLDPGNLILSGFEPLEIVEAVGTEIRHVYADDAARDIVGLRPGVAARGATVMLGRGSVDYPALLGALEERQYRGYLSVASSGTVDAATELSSAIKYLRSL